MSKNTKLLLIEFITTQDEAKPRQAKASARLVGAFSYSGDPFPVDCIWATVVRGANRRWVEKEGTPGVTVSRDFVISTASEWKKNSNNPDDNYDALDENVYEAIKTTPVQKLPVDAYEAVAAIAAVLYQGQENPYPDAKSVADRYEGIESAKKQERNRLVEERREREAAYKKSIADSEVKYGLKEGDPVYFIPGATEVGNFYFNGLDPESRNTDDWYVEEAYTQYVTPQPFTSGVLEGDHYIHEYEIDTEAIKDRIDILPAPADYGWTYYAPFKDNPKVQVVGQSHEDIYIRAAVIQAVLDRYQRQG